MNKPQDAVIGIDIGTSKVALVAGVLHEGMTQVVGVGIAPNTGVRKGAIVDLEDTVSALSASREAAEQTSGIELKSAVVGVGGTQITVQEAKGVIAVSRADGEIGDNDLERVMEAARVVAVPPNREILHMIPRAFAVDGQRGIKDPVGLTGVRLEVEAQVVSAQASAMRNVIKCVEQSGLSIIDTVFSPLATAKTLLNKKQRESGVMMVDIGAGTTSMVVFEEGDMIHAAVLPVGSMHITNDIAIGLRISLDAAEKVKIRYGAADKEHIKDTDMISLSLIEGDEKDRIQRKYLVEIIEARLNEIFSMIRDELRKIGKDGMLPAGVIFTGGGSRLDGLVDFAKEYLHLPAAAGNPFLEVSGVVDQLDDPSFSSALGLMLWGLEDIQSRPKLPTSDVGKIGGGLLDKARNVFKQFLP